MASRMELIDTLCSEEESTPFSIDYLYWLEGLTYPELVQLGRAHSKGEPMPFKPSLADLEEMPATIRRRLAEAMGVPREKSGEFAGANVEKAKNLDSVARSLQRAGAQIPAGRAELLSVATTLYASMVSTAIGGVDELEVSLPEASWAVEVAEGLIAAVDKRAMPRMPAPEVEVDDYVVYTGDEFPELAGKVGKVFEMQPERFATVSVRYGEECGDGEYCLVPKSGLRIVDKAEAWRILGKTEVSCDGS